VKVAIAAAVLVLLAGCIGSTSPALPENADTRTSTRPERPLDFGDNCAQATSILAYAGAEKIGPFVREDIRSDFPNARIDTLGRPITGPVSGSYSSFLHCESPEHTLLFGFTGPRVKPPEWDDSGIERHYVITHLFYGTPEEAHLLMERLEWMVDPLVRGSVDNLIGNRYTFSFATGTNMCDYDGVVEASRVDRAPPITSRLWSWHEDEQGNDVLHALDFKDVADPEGVWLGAGESGAILHWNNDQHGVPSVAGNHLSAAGQPSWGEAQFGFSRLMSYGPSLVR
jgi:hypothetical protein